MRRNWRTGLIGLAALLAGGVEWLPAQDPARGLEGAPVLAVRHRTEDPQRTSLEPAALARIIAQQPGEPYSAQKIRQSIERLFTTGRFADIRVDAEQEAGGVVLTFLTRGRSFIGAVFVRGVPAPPSEIQLRSATRLQLGQPFSEDDLPMAIEGLRRALESEGYFRAEIQHRLEPRPETQQMDVVFDVRPGSRAQFGAIQVAGNAAFPADRLVRQARWEAGEDFVSRRLQNGLTRLQDLYREADYLEASIRVAQRTYRPETNRVDLELEVTEGARIEINVSGASLGRSDLERLVPVFEERTLDEDLLREGERNLENYFESQGYFDASVHTVRQPPTNGMVRIEYEVELGPQHYLAAVEFRGNQYFREETLRERMQIQPATVTQRGGRFSSSLLERDLAAIRAVYRTNGFPQVRVEAQRIEQDSESHQGLLLAITVEEGRQVLVGDFAITGNQALPLELLEGYINAGSGQPYSESVITSDRDNLLTLYFNEGFPDARFDWRATPSEDGTRMNLEYILEEGAREYIGHVYVSGLEYTRLGIVNRQLQFRDGDPLSQGQLIESQRRLYDLGIFSQVEMAVQNPAGTEPERTVLVQVEEARRYTFRIGLGADIGRFGGSSRDPDTAEDKPEIEGKPEISPNISFDITRLNVGGRPHTASFRSRFSTLQKRAGLTYLAPRFLNHPWLNASAAALFDETQAVRTFTSRRLEASLQFESKWSRVTTLFTRYSFRRVATVDAFPLTSPNQIALLRDPALVGILNQTWLRDTRDNPTDTQRGMFSTVDFGVAAKQLGSETSFLRLVLQNSSSHPVWRRLTLARSFQFGAQSPFGEGRTVEVNGQPGTTREIPPPERFFAGGGNSHRGFAVNQAGPRKEGFAVGGNALLFHSLELRFPVWGENINGVLFHDMGNVFERVRDLTLRQHQRHPEDFRYLVHAVGLGARYRTPVGPVRFDVGYNLNPTRVRLPTDEIETLSRWQFLVSIGQSF